MPNYSTKPLPQCGSLSESQQSPTPAFKAPLQRLTLGVKSRVLALSHPNSARQEMCIPAFVLQTAASSIFQPAPLNIHQVPDFEACCDLAASSFLPFLLKCGPRCRESGKAATCLCLSSSSLCNVCSGIDLCTKSTPVSCPAQKVHVPFTLFWRGSGPKQGSCPQVAAFGASRGRRSEDGADPAGAKSREEITCTNPMDTYR